MNEANVCIIFTIYISVKMRIDTIQIKHAVGRQVGRIN
jgi:hypothetical protein